MDNIFITQFHINKVRHLKDIHIDLSENSRKHLIFTGKNGSGKTSVLDSLSLFLSNITETKNVEGYKENLQALENNLNLCSKEVYYYSEAMADYQNTKDSFTKYSAGLDILFNQDLRSIYNQFQAGECIVAYYKADRIFKTELPTHVEKVVLRNNYTILENPRTDFVKYLLDLKMTEALALTGNKLEKADQIKNWFLQFENLLKRVFDNDSIQLIFNEDTFEFHIHEDGKEDFDFNSLSSGYAAVLDIVVDILLRMEKKSSRTFKFDMPGIVLIDEIENHLHLELQKRILDLLISIFPNIQFVISTHSPFILNSISNVIIYDLEQKICVPHGLSDIPYEGVVEGYFKADTLSNELKEKFNRYKELVKKKDLLPEDFDEITKLELYLDEIPDYLALNVTTEYQNLKLTFESRDDIS